MWANLQISKYADWAHTDTFFQTWETPRFVDLKSYTYLSPPLNVWACAKQPPEQLTQQLPGALPQQFSEQWQPQWPKRR